MAKNPYVLWPDRLSCLLAVPGESAANRENKQRVVRFRLRDCPGGRELQLMNTSALSFTLNVSMWGVSKPKFYDGGSQIFSGSAQYCHVTVVGP